MLFFLIVVERFEEWVGFFDFMWLRLRLFEWNKNCFKVSWEDFWEVNLRSDYKFFLLKAQILFFDYDNYVFSIYFIVQHLIFVWLKIYIYTCWKILREIFWASLEHQQQTVLSWKVSTNNFYEGKNYFFLKIRMRCVWRKKSVEDRIKPEI